MEQKKTILVIDDSPDTLEIIARNLTTWGYEIITSTNAQDGLSLLKEK